MKLTAEQMYSEMLEENAEGKWINPRFEKVRYQQDLSHFMIFIDDFSRIHESLNVSIYSISKYPEYIIIHCKQDFL